MLGISIDSKFCHKAWAETFGGIDFPLLADFHPKGAMAKSYGLMLEDKGITDRATVLVGKDGNVLWSESVGPGGARQPGDLLEPRSGGGVVQDQLDRLADEGAALFRALLRRGTRVFASSRKGAIRGLEQRFQALWRKPDPLCQLGE